MMDGETITRRETREVVLLADHPALTVTWSRYGPGEEGPGLHVHREHTDAFYVLEGELTFAVGPAGDPLPVGPGGFVAVPPHVAHGFANAGAAEVRWLNFHAPDTGFATYMRGARDGETVAWDSFDPPADGGRPAGEVVVAQPGEVALADLAVAVLDTAPDPRPGEFRLVLADGRTLAVTPA
jgi:mannose-6-phosphate isomerase-like protein (cupin superfamily)